MTRQVQDAYIVAATRTPIGKAPKGMFRNMRPDDLLVAAIRSAMKQVPSLDPKAVEDAIIGCAMPEAEQGLNVARVAVLLAGLPNTTGGVTINRFCSSGLNAVAIAADRIRVGEADVMIAGGAESMSMVPMSGNKPALNRACLREGRERRHRLRHGHDRREGRRAVEGHARDAGRSSRCESHQKAIAATEGGRVHRRDDADRGGREVPEPGEPRARCQDAHGETRRRSARRHQRSRRWPSCEPVFAAKGSVTAGNSSQTSDGAGALILCSERALKQYNLTPLARFVSFAVKGVPPEIMGIGPKYAIPAALASAGLKAEDMGWIELNEAFAAQAVAVINDLGLDRSKVNPMGGAIALGHPLGATGAIRAATVVHALRRRNLKYGMVTMCVGTGMGAAGIFERV